MTTDQPTVDDASFADPYFLIGYIDAIARDTGYPCTDAQARADIIAALDKNKLERQRAQEITDAWIARMDAARQVVSPPPIDLELVDQLCDHVGDCGHKNARSAQ